MPFIPHTPESFMTRSDSKDPKLTCRGITSSGRPCRRALAIGPQTSLKASQEAREGVLAVLPASFGASQEVATFFCWQHKEQAATWANTEEKTKKATINRLGEKTSIDTMVERFGGLDTQRGEPLRERKHHIRNSRPSREALPPKRRGEPGLLFTVSEEKPPIQRPLRRNANSKRRIGGSGLFLSLFCCMDNADIEHGPPQRSRPHPRLPEISTSETARIPSHVCTLAQPSPKAAQNTHLQQNRRQSSPNPSTPQASKRTIPTTRPPLPRDPTSQTESLLALIPRTLSPQTTSLLLTELAKPVSTHDEEGYIYMFWLTPSTTPTPTPQAASSLLSTPSKRPLNLSDHRQTCTSPSTVSAKTNDSPTILLKIGRASNVQRRLNEWSRQCNHTLSLIRFYPYLPSSSPPFPPSPSFPPESSPLPRKVPHAHKIERLIHLELAEKRVRKGCETCGKEHREWFEVEGTRNGVRGVDEVVRRWVGWGEREMGKE